MSTHEETVVVPCLHCKAPAGQFCRSASGTYLKGWYAHNVRHEAYGEYSAPPQDSMTMTLVLDHPKLSKSPELAVIRNATEILLSMYGTVSWS